MVDKRRIGIIGGTFNPIHLGHLMIAEVACESFNLEKVIFVPARIPPHKQHDVIDSHHRYAMTAAAVLDNPNFDISDVEMRRAGYSYNVDKIKYFNKVMKQNNLDLLDISNLYASYKSVISKNIDNLFYQDQLIKTQEKAIYSVKNALHYPLNLLDYLHFTAPIRRFVDLINHYQLSQYLAKKDILNEAVLSIYCEEINQKEKEVNKFTSQLNKLLAIIYYSTNKQLVNGYVTGFFGSRMDILLENNLYVSIPLSSMDNYYIISEDRLMCYNLKDNKKYKIGDKLKVKPYLLDIENLVIDFKIVNGDNQE